ncbi:MAG TPA: hypothetical protein VK390_05070 [Propionibacteriaceae bacterium]|jgi:hypothetical protein|nr:hypothetical protein [Propionibacteriaceae bacterium]
MGDFTSDKYGRLPLVGSRRHRAGKRQGVLDSREQARSQELVLQIVCARDGNPTHGQQVILTVYRDLVPGGTEGIFTRGPEANAQWIDAPDARGKLSPKCPKCGANPQFTTETMNKMINTMLQVSCGQPLNWRWDFRRHRLLK